ncbi:hypothetical protein [Aquamicrobium ahrensii]|uniref:FAD/FMN-containing dehydrogenase n=1 Tax=Aquamicrobium ahrensii TaxID=469551 RepID=A0ABV2KSM2_9HYPH
MIATNAGELLAIRYGRFRNQALGNLPRMIIGSAGTLAVVTAAMLRLHLPALLQSAALCACGSVEAALATLPLLKSGWGFV